MATIKGVKVCPECKNELEDPVPEFCPHCGSDEAKVREEERSRKVEGFTCPVSIFEQYSRQMKAAEKERDRLMSNGDPVKEDPVVAVTSRFLAAYRDMPIDARKGVLFDADQIMKAILHSRLSGEQIKSLVAIAKNIGKMAEAAEAFITARGSVIRV